MVANSNTKIVLRPTYFRILSPRIRKKNVNYFSIAYCTLGFLMETQYVFSKVGKYFKSYFDKSLFKTVQAAWLISATSLSHGTLRFLPQNI